MMNSLSRQLRTPMNSFFVCLISFYTFLWGAWALIPEWSLFGQGKSYQFIASIAPEWAWGLVAVVFGLLVILGAVKRSFKIMYAGAHLSFYFWLVLAIGFWIGNWQGLWGVTATLFTIYFGLTAANIRVNRDNLTHNISKDIV